MILGLDISTSITGATILDKTGEMLYNRSWDTRNKKKYSDLYKKADFIKTHLVYIKEHFPINQIYVEQSLQSFRSGFSSAHTLSTLSRFNGIISWISYELFDLEPQMLAAISARKLVGVVKKKGENAKEKCLEFVVDTVPGFMVEYTKFGNPRPGTYDRSDSYIIAKAGLIKCKNNKF
jgi:hypothetical protein